MTRITNVATASPNQKSSDIARDVRIRTSFGPDEFPYPRAFADQWTSRRAVSDAAPDVLRAVESGISGVLHVGGPRRTVLEYARSLDPAKEIGALSIKDVSFSVPEDTSLDTSRFSREVGN